MATKKNILVNGVLTPVWQTDATAQQIDDAVGKAASAAAYGYGGALPVIDINNDETAFNAAVDALLDEMPNYTMRQLRYANYPVGGQQGPIFAGALYRHNASYAYLRGSSYGGGTIQKCKSAGAWTPWEWVNPPLVLGVEYRTTERYLGGAVRKMVTSGFEVWEEASSSKATVSWPSTGKTLSFVLDAGGSQAIALPPCQTFLASCTDNIRAGVALVQTANSVIKSITTLVPLANWSIVAGDALSVKVAESDGRYGMALHIAMI